MTQAQADAYLCGSTPEQHEGRFIAQLMVPYVHLGPLCRGQRVLDVGFGDGFGVDILAQTADQAIGIDTAPGNMARARAKYRRPNLQFLQMNATAMTFPDDHFDLITSCQVIEHIPEPLLPAYLKEIARVLKPDGAFWVSTLNLEVAQKPGQPYTKLEFHEKEFTAAELEALLRQTFPSVTMYGVDLTAQHRLYRRLKKWGLMRVGPARWNPVARYLDSVTPEHFCVSPHKIRQAFDLFTCCRK
jgi:ubiquinone/menaquinone biosynthesis C-methylase UbiE